MNRTSTHRLLLLALCSLCLCGSLIGCDGTTGAAKSGGTISLIVSGDTTGWLMPCGCATNQSGGLLRRGTFVRQLAAQGPVVYADAGGAPAGTSEYSRLKFETILRGELLMRVAAHNIGGPEAAMGTDDLRDVGKRLNVPFVSANVTDASGQSIASASRVLDVAGKRVAIVGVMSPTFATSEIRVDDPQAAVQRTILSIKGTYDLLVILAYLPEDELQKLAANTPEADAVVGGPTGQAMAPRRVGPTVLASATNKGKFLVQLDLSSQPISGTVVEMGPSWADDPEQTANLKSYLAELARRDFRADETGLVQAASEVSAAAPGDYRITGSASCASCHQSAHASWQASKHAHALQTLHDKGFDVDPNCQQCHTTGYGQPGGFVSLSQSAATLGGVGCENCHGPSAAHVKDSHVRTAFANASVDQCVRCHDHENSPHFSFDMYWPKIRHGTDVKVTEQSAKPQ